MIARADVVALLARVVHLVDIATLQKIPLIVDEVIELDVVY